jgi:hypothetical protein
MPDNVPDPRPNPSFSPRESRPADPGLQDLSTQADTTAGALRNLSEAGQQFLDRLQHLQQQASQRALEQFQSRVQAPQATPRPLASTLPPPPSLPPVPPVPRAPAPAPLRPAPPAPTDPLQDYLAGLDPERQRLAQEAHKRAKYAVAPPANPEMLRRQQEQVNISRQPMVVLGHGLLVPQTPAPAPAPLPTPAPDPLQDYLAGLNPERRRSAQESHERSRRAAPPPTPERLAEIQARANATQQPFQLPGHGLVLPAQPPAPTPPPPPPQPPVSPLAARVQASQRQTPTAPPPVALPQPNLGGLAGRLMGVAPPPAAPAGSEPLPQAIPLPPSAGPSPLAARVGGQLQELQRRMRQAENEDLARQAQEAMQRAQEEEQEQQAQARYHAQHAAYQRLETPLARAAYEAPLRDEMREETGRYQRQQRAGAIEGRLIGGPESQALTRAQVEAQEQARTNQARQQAQAEQARAAYLETPEGRQQTRQQRDAQRQQQEALEVQRRRENVDQYGRLGVALREAREHLTDFAGVVSTVGGTVTTVFNVIQGLAGAASPQAGATFSRSVDLLMARVGRSAVPVLNTASGLVQEAARNVDNLTLGNVARNMLPIPQAPREGDRPARSFGQFFLDRLTFGLTEKDKPPPLQSFEGLPPGGYALGPEQYYERIQQAGMNVSPIDAAVLMEQLQNTVGLLERVVVNTQNLQNLIPTWR